MYLLDKEITLRKKQHGTLYGGLTHGEKVKKEGLKFSQSCYGKVLSIYIRRRINGKLKLIKIGQICDGCSQVWFNKETLRENNLLLKQKK